MSVFQLYESHAIGFDNPQHQNGAHGQVGDQDDFRNVNEGHIVHIRMIDMAHYEQQLPQDYEFDAMEVIVIGQVVKRGKRALVVTHQLQPDEDQIRNVTAIPWQCILEIRRLYYMQS